MAASTALLIEPRVGHVSLIGSEATATAVRRVLDDAGKVWLLECNDSPGLEYVGAHFVGPWPALEPPPLSPALPPALSLPTPCSCLQARTS